MLTDINAIGKNMKRLRKERQLTLEKLAELTDMSINTIARFELGKNQNIKLDTLLKICEALDTTPNELLGIIQSSEGNTKEYSELISVLSALSEKKRRTLMQLLVAFINA
ncbi:helix-turn-helix domain-containing protein [Fructobacillus sp. M158]|uniref:helix-turn-helix domain-containing protein n=1 Tax=Fructobacillus parabroussonetiae TaxID=2713174 RepID=UPI00200B9618|nr:helix-turn-helix transcriptional regulator [Fructobacillus parabroussonetiae]MCK8617445.1 helix-turn-helix domain-containing protein [Fructobacillus parabroussonetiae]